jgi:SAM-dependent methyltransferase
MAPRTHDYLFHVYERLRAERGPIRALDFGCGAGQLITRAHEHGYDDFWGAETYYGDESIDERTTAAIPAATAERIMRIGDDDILPFPDQQFDFVCSSQVFEHLANPALVIDELARVTKPGGVHMHVLPTREAIVEGHLNVPLYHRMPHGLRERYVRWFYNRGRAKFSDQTSDFDEWWGQMGPFMKDQVFHRPWREFEDAFSTHFDVLPREKDKLLFHLGQRNGLLFRAAAWLVAAAPVALVSRMELRRAGAAVELRLTRPNRK